MKKKIGWVIFKKTIGIQFPGEWWEEFSSEKKARSAMKNIYGTEIFRLARITYEEKFVAP